MLSRNVARTGVVEVVMGGYRLLHQLVLCLLLAMPACVSAMTVAFINPGKSDEIFWLTASHSMSAAAHSLGIRLEVLYAQRDHLQVVQLARQLAARTPLQRPEYVILSNDYGVAAEAIRILDGAGIKTFLAFSGIRDPQERQRIGLPRTKYPGWLGSLEPLTAESGYLTARALIARGNAEHWQDPEGRLHLLVIAGDRSTTTSLKRNEGMRRAVVEAGNVVIDQEIYGEWARAKAEEQSQWLYQRYPQARLIWSGNDLMAFGAMNSWRLRGGKPGVDAHFSAINTSDEALTALQSGSISALAGGHFIAGAFALVMLYDYHNGKDFSQEGLEQERSMSILFSRDDARRFKQLFGDLDFDRVDFRKFSRVLHPASTDYTFNFRALLSAGKERK
ncbi:MULTISPECIES: ABC transporter substrate-binding protein [unclassified Undibacterium]|uniref:ABC transporter substrate-binding protein n=1 Tax=unclassified Undibacterium TaxID=2630295 RepID=UPI002AC9312D|nr:MULTISPECIES: ABC transporter substrate-binding protein [unclassified Undibacterium]MEB0139583.1 ABC transporter substrate-binding protein [Undibacterium sp. CCC2.1]MEB0172486.1 ABC transporter substrate-binding protein [Undibacterium sp. CCC1.1]MEB0176504.1 ABC transporter substrate-binding protein [Undibacterium sp. CCC3.4]MEB0215642.1 ABC transporter substrate-binding protein [Undibacterium sp. 5I2]WPX43961.1 ABC transporter substrate-binding protein [Undibacterium sp. CCC3.4]